MSKEEISDKDSNVSEERFSLDLNDVLDTYQYKHAFIAKVYGMLVSQILLASVILVALNTNHRTREWIFQKKSIGPVFAVLLYIFCIVLLCCNKVRNQAPINKILMGALTISTGVYGGIFGTYHRLHIILYSIGITYGIFLLVALLVRNQLICLSSYGRFFTLSFFAMGLYAIICAVLDLVGVLRRYPLVDVSFYALSLVMCTAFMSHVTDYFAGDSMEELLWVINANETLEGAHIFVAELVYMITFLIFFISARLLGLTIE